MTISKSRRKVTVAQFLEAQINSSDKAQHEIAEEVGFAKPTMVSMVKLGKAKVPLDKAQPIAKALGIDSRDFFMRCLEEYLPVVFNEIVELTKDQPILSQNEIDIIKRIREARPENPSIKTPEQNRAFDNFLATLTGE
ncbi:helix-turn-helix transcriptional regulator [Acinetobacter johnsonii]|jgi:transcriptional regulator with XRE-family HTH domain|uniref:helix-turn-helix domain-containing protein n=1 Tax=Acinetobacter johnsonii TaxID=40214 RepID=UPI00244D0DA5|nr:helix-turn-helix transcriptional regulator [Acinetobacter johnsonii]MDH2045623.1 helix-turn-helix transcriptional regulator [Acinetobacter johnsonii]